MTARTLIHSATLVSDGAVTEDGWITFSDGTIDAVGQGNWADLAAKATSIVDAAGGWLTPGFIDLHCHGAGGGRFDGGPTDIRRALKVHRSHGTTRTLLSLSTAALEGLSSQLESAAQWVRSDPLVLGIHLEGPFLELEHRGAHSPELLRRADPAAIDQLLECGDDLIVQVTLAPEQPGGMAALQQFLHAGVKVAVGHTGASYEEALVAFDAGATILTHAFNGMPGIHHRSPGPVAAALHSGGVTLEVINDGIHVHPEIVGLVFASAPDRIALITDSMAATGRGDGDYPSGSRMIIVRDGVAMLADRSSIAGSTLTLDVALRRAVTVVGLPVSVAVRALTETPAKALGLHHQLGRLAPGFAADAVVMSPAFDVERVWAAGSPIETRG